MAKSKAPASKKKAVSKKASTNKAAAKKTTRKTPAKKRAAAKKTASKAPAKKKAAAKKTASKAPARKKRSAGRKAHPSFMRPQQPDSVLASIVGNKPMPRTQVTKRIWSHIKKNNLQDTQNRRMINADDKLREVFGGKKQVSMFEMTKLVNQHLTEV